VRTLRQVRSRGKVQRPYSPKDLKVPELRSLKTRFVEGGREEE